MMNMALAQLQTVTVTYRRGRSVFREVSWEAPLHAGLVVLTGPSGSGKTTILHLLTGMIRPASGSVRTLETEVSSAPAAVVRALRRDRVGHVFQDFRLLAELTVAENVALPLWLQGRSSASARQRAMEVLEELDLGWTAARRPSQLSGGEQQRVALARALATRPSLILADEPTANLDDGSAATVAALLRAVVDDERHVIVASHDRRLYDGTELVYEVTADAITEVTGNAGKPVLP